MKFSLKKILSSLFHLGDVYVSDDFGSYGKNVFLPRNLVLSNSKNIFLGNNVQIGEHAILFATNAQIVIKDYFVSADSLKIATGQHERRIGRFLGSITEVDKNHNLGLDKQVIINEDVWAGFNVTILPGVEIGRGCTLAAGAVITKSTPPYSVVGGNPAKFIKFYWSIEEIIDHEARLYEPSKRLTNEYLKEIFDKYI